jgi:hypothetical protein
MEILIVETLGTESGTQEITPTDPLVSQTDNTKKTKHKLSRFLFCQVLNFETQKTHEFPYHYGRHCSALYMTHPRCSTPGHGRTCFK